MSLGCAIGGHKAEGRQTYNSGYYFGLCRRCGDYLIRSAHGEWQSVPPGHKVVWKAGRHSHSLEPDFEGALPVVCGEARLSPPRRPRRHSRALVPLRQRPAAGATAGAASEECDDIRFPRLLFLGVLAGAGVKMLLGLAGGR